MTYTSEDIKVIRGLGFIRRRPQLYFSESGRNICHSLLSSILESLVDESYGCCAKIVRIKALSKGGVRFKYNGRGMPLELSQDNLGPFPQPLVYGAIMRFNGGYEGRELATHGHLRKVGPYLAAMSEELTILSSFEGKTYSVSFEYGAVSSMLSEESGTLGENEIYVRFEPKLLNGNQISSEEIRELIETARTKHPDIVFEQA